MRRLFWLALGVTLGVLIMRKVSELAAKLTPQGMAEGLSTAVRDLASAVGEFGAEVRTAMADRENELRRATGMDGTTGQPPRHPEPELPRTGRHAAD